MAKNPKAVEKISQEVRNAFAEMDKDNSGLVCISEFMEFCSKIPGMTNVATEFLKGDKSGDMKISLEELNAMVNSIPADQINESHVECLFHERDKNGDERLDKDEFGALLREQGYSETCVANTIKAVAGDDGFVTLKEFLDDWRKQPKS